MRETLLFTLLLVALLPIILLFVINWWILSRHETINKNIMLSSTVTSLYALYNQEKGHLEASLDNFAYTLSNLKTADQDEDNKLPFLIAAFKESANLDFLNIVDSDKKVLARALSDKTGDKINYPLYFDNTSENEVLITTELITDEDLINENTNLLENSSISIIKNPEKSTFYKSQENQGLYLVGIKPVYNFLSDKENYTEAYLVGGILLNSQFYKTKYDVKSLDKIQIHIVPYYKPQKSYKNKVVQTIHNFKGNPVANIEVVFDPAQTRQELSETSFYTIIVYIITLILVVLASVFVSRYLVGPLVALDEATKEIAKDNFDLKLAVKGPVEIEDLAFALNKMTHSLAEKRRMQEDFIATLTHDMRVPILAEQKALDLIVNDDRFKLSDDQQTLIDNMISSNKDLLRLVNNLLDTYKLEAGKYKLDIADHNILNTLEESINELIPLAKENNQTIELISETEHHSVRFDRSEIKRVIRNLLSNAIKFSPQNTQITAKLYEDEKNIIFSFQDNGKGMTEEEIMQLFQRYASGAKKLKKVGTGLGLYLSYCIILAHNGKIWVESQLNKGSTFYVAIPKTHTK